MRRREFLAAALAPRAGAKIQRIIITPIEGRFHKTVAMNSYDRAPKGDTYQTHLLRIFTDQGVQGTGTLDYSTPDAAMLEALRGLVAVDAAEALRHPLVSRHRFLDSALFDLAGQIEGKPCYELLGGPVRERVEVYDGTLYFSDVMRPEKGVRAVVEEAEEAVRAGYRGTKLKVGRNGKWMPGRAGIDRDIEVVNAVRKAVGPRVRIMADANNGYRGDFEGAWRFLAETQKSNLYWIEEIFPQDAALYGRLKEKMEQAGMKTLLADGEDMRTAEDLRPYLAPRRLIDLTQIDIRRAGFLGNREAAELSAAHGAVCVPHNWGSQIGGLMGLHLARSAPGVIAAEDDRSRCDAIVAEGYTFRDGYYQLGKMKGLGIRVNAKVYADRYQRREMVVG
jgi:L-alanine-DL-glutamate epimerase-like enolase superfamily enzyme